MINIDKPSEDLDYKIEYNQEQEWTVKYLTGDYKDIEISFSGVRIDGISNQLTFNVTLVNNPYESLDVTDVDFANFNADVLEDIIVNNKEAIEVKEVSDGEDTDN